MMLKPLATAMVLPGSTSPTLNMESTRGSWATASRREDGSDARLATAEKYCSDEEPRPIRQEGCWRSRRDSHRHRLGHPRDMIATADLTDGMGRTDSPTERILTRLVHMFALS